MKISIIITIYNVEQYIAECLDSVLGQTYKNLEVILVDDCCTDSTLEIVMSYAQKDPRIRIIQHEVNLGAGWGRKHGIEAATGDYLITVDGDDWLSPDFIEKLVIGAKNTNADIVSGGLTAVYDGYEEIKRFAPKTSVGIQKFKDYTRGRVVFLNNKLVRREMYEIVPYSTRRYCEDTPVVLPLLYYANKVVYVDTQGYFYRQRPTSLCHTVGIFEEILYKSLCSAELRRFFESKGPEYDGIINKTEFVHWIQILKDTITDELAVKYRSELGELMPGVLRILDL